MGTLGYDANKIGDNEYRIIAEASAITPSSRVEAMALKRAVELAEEGGFSHLQILKKQSLVRCQSQYGATISTFPRIVLTVRLGNEENKYAVENYVVADLRIELEMRLQPTEFTLDERRRIAAGYRLSCMQRS